jgi:CBS domain-containing protein
MMKENEVRHLLVKEGEEIIGIVSSKDINRALVNILANI